MSARKLLLLGATGFVGMNVLPVLQRAGFQVVAGVRRPGLPLPCDTMPLEALRQTAHPGFDAIVSLAGVGNPAQFERDGEAAQAEAEFGIVDSIVDMAVQQSVASVLFLSTAGAAYGDGWQEGRRHVFQESDPCQPLSVYGQVKVAAERRLRQALNQRAPGVACAVVRASNIYGLRYAKGGQQGLVNALIERALAAQPVSVFGDGHVYRDYLHASDLASAIVSAVRVRADGLFNVGSGVTHSILDVIALVEAAVGRPFERRQLPARAFDVKYAAIDTALARRTLAWTPAIGLSDGITEIVTEVRKLQQA